jgi:pentatricopeptide repeat protein
MPTSLRLGLKQTHLWENNLVNMYAKCRSMDDAHNVFDKMPEPDVVSWTSVIAGYAQCGAVKEAVGLFDMMKRAGIKPDFITFGCVLRACAAGTEALAEGQRVHAATVKFGHELDDSIQEALILMYAQCGRLGDSRKAFNNKTPKDNNNIVSGPWNAMIAVNLFTQMHRASIRANHLTLAHVLGVFARPEALCNRSNRSMFMLLKLGSIRTIL